VSEVVKHDFFCAKKDFLSKEEVEQFKLFLDRKEVECGCINKIVQSMVDWNQQTLKFDISPMLPVILNYTAFEAQVKSTPAPDHAIHIGNIAHPNPAKWVAIVNLHDRDEVQGGELTFRKWAPTPYKDNFGNWRGDPNKPHVPQWANECGSIIIYPAMVENGYTLVTSGTAHRAKVLINGPQFV